VTQSPANRPAGAAGSRPAFLPNEVDPTVFDETFLRQLERLLLLLRSPVRGGLKGGRRSVKRGQSVEFADYRDYAPGDDLRQLDWNVFARLEKLFVKLFVEEEDVTITLLLDASASMASGTPEKLLFAKRAAAALGYIGLASEDRVAISALGGRTSRRQVALRGSGRVFRLLSSLSAIEPAPGPTDLVAAARHAAAQLSGRGVIVLISDLLGKRVAGGEMPLTHSNEETLQFSTNVSVAPGTYIVRVAVMDSGGRVGSVDHRADARDVQLLHPDNERIQGFAEEDRAIVSEPLEALPGLWREVPASTAIVVQPGADEEVAFRPRAS